ncbi:hypothetical protein J5681_06655 [bacterium]|nr:hypothetical protein [bacterium]
MKKFSVVLISIFALFFFVSCGGDNDEGDTSADTGDSSADTDTGDTDPADSGDTAADTGDTAADTDTDTDTDADTDTEQEDPSDTDTGEIEPGECPVININFMKFETSFDSYAYYSGVYAPNTGSATEDEIDFEIYSETAAGTYDLSEGYNASYSSCAQCIMVYEDIVYDNEGYFEGAGKYYYPESGTMTVNSFSYDSGTLNITLENVKLIQVTREYDSENDGFKSEPVENGSCLVIQNTTLNI